MRRAVSVKPIREEKFCLLPGILSICAFSEALILSRDGDSAVFKI